MTNKEILMQKLGLKEQDFEPKDKLEDTDAALCELAEMLAEQEDAIVELAELIGGIVHG